MSAPLMGFITQATTDQPDVPANIQYAATTTDGFEVVNVPLSAPIGGRPISENDPVQGRLIPAKVGDPCFISNVIGRMGIIVLTERENRAVCQSGGGA